MVHSQHDYLEIYCFCLYQTRRLRFYYDWDYLQMQNYDLLTLYLVHLRLLCILHYLWLLRLQLHFYGLVFLLMPYTMDVFVIVLMCLNPTSPMHN